MKNKVGKPKKYSLQELRQQLLNYVQKHPNKVISYIDLERETGISRNTWSRNLKDEIAKLNAPIPFTTKIDFDTGIPLPNIFDIVEKNYDNKQKGCFCPSPRKGGIRTAILYSSKESSRVKLVRISSLLILSRISSIFTTVGDLLNS